ncbi:MAG: hypothetical protein ACSLE4_07395 [Methyloceanibacter sp.]|uniref:hypothetical protein n=1 Tax=Methyloceanibacter sp. TaxID=1965321 RepID=UPI003EDE83DC
MGVGMTLRRWLALLAAMLLGTLFGTTVTFKQALAEFEIQESQVEKGEVEVEYRGAVHWGFPGAEREEAEGGGDDDDDVVGALEEEEEGEFLRQSHDIELQWSVTDRWMFSTALSADEPLDEDFDLSTVEIELQYELIEREGDGLGLAFLGAYGFATRSGEVDEIEFGPIVEWESRPLLLTINPFLTSQVGDNRETDGLGFEYGWRAEYKVARRWGVGVEMFGEIEDLSHAGSFDDQEHSIGPTLFYNPGDDDDAVGGEGEDEDDEVAGPAEMEFVFNVGVQFGLTDMTSDTALKFQGALEF